MARKKNIAAGLDAVIYARYSSHNQREVSIEQQIAECTKHAAALGLRIVGTYEDRAISGKTDNRPRFQQMMRDAEKGSFRPSWRGSPTASGAICCKPWSTRRSWTITA